MQEPIIAAIQAAAPSGISPREVGELLGLVTVAVGLIVGAFKLGSYSRDQVAHEERVAALLVTLTQRVDAHAVLDLATFDTVRREATTAHVAADQAREKALTSLVTAAELAGRVTRLDDPSSGALVSVEIQIKSIRERLHELGNKLQGVYGADAMLDLRVVQCIKDLDLLTQRVAVIEEHDRRSGPADRRQDGA